MTFPKRSTPARWAWAPSAWVPVALTLLILAALTVPAQGQRRMPEFADQSPAAWINSEPLSRDDLRGEVVLIEIWTSV